MIRMLTDADFPPLFGHMCRHAGESGRDGDPIFRPCSQHEVMDEVQISQRHRAAWARGLDQPLWLRTWGVVVDQVSGPVKLVPLFRTAAQKRELFERIQRPDLTYRHRWQKGDLLIWDNCAVQHRAICDYELPLRRRMERTTLTGTAPYL